MKRKVGDFDIDWIGGDRIEVTRDNPPRHRYQYETCPDRRRVKRLLLTLPEEVAGGDPLLDADRCEEEARKAAGEFLEQETGKSAENDPDRLEPRVRKHCGCGRSPSAWKKARRCAPGRGDQ